MGELKMGDHGSVWPFKLTIKSVRLCKFNIVSWDTLGHNDTTAMVNEVFYQRMFMLDDKCIGKIVQKKPIPQQENSNSKKITLFSLKNKCMT
jgi:hypothetical protein